jgi:hypothetical protein
MKLVGQPRNENVFLHFYSIKKSKLVGQQKNENVILHFYSIEEQNYLANFKMKMAFCTFSV